MMGNSQLINEMRGAIKRILQEHGSLKEAFQLDDEKNQMLTAYAIELAKQEKTESAYHLLAALEVIDPENSTIPTCLGTLLMQKKAFHAAITHFSYALKIDPANKIASMNLGETYLLLGDLRSAVQYLNAAVQTSSNDDPYSNRAKMLLALIGEIAKEFRTHGPEGLEEIKKRIQM